MDLLSTIGQELRSHKVAFAEHWGDTLNALQLGRLRNQLREADVSLDDILVAEVSTRSGRPRRLVRAEEYDRMRHLLR